MDTGTIRQGKEEWTKRFGLDEQPPVRDHEGNVVDAIYTPADIADTDFMTDIGFPGEYPFTRGPYPEMSRRRPWRFAILSGFGTPEDTNRRWKFLYEGGQRSFTWVPDLPTQAGLDSDDPRAESEVGLVGMAVDTARDLEIAYSPLSSTDQNLSPFEVDYNNDGTKDLLVGTAEGMVALLTNTGTDTQPVFAGYDFLKADGKTIDVGTHAAPFMVDYNNDGIRDLLVGNGEGFLLYYENRGSTNHAVFAPPTTLKDVHGTRLAVDSFCTPCIVDWDDDNKKDILLGGANGTLVIYRNEGSDSEPLFSSPTPIEVDGVKINFTGQVAPVVGDWNDDGGKDLLVRNQEGLCLLFLNEVVGGEPDLFSAEQFQPGDSKFTSFRFPVPIPFYWNQFTKEYYPDGNSLTFRNHSL